MTLRVIPLELTEANALVAKWHRHHKPCQGHRFSIGCIDNSGEVHGAAIVGRPVARLAGAPRDVLEVTRLVTDGTKNACSILYGAAARVGQTLGYIRIQTYILETENGASLRASGWVCEGESGGGQWKHTDGKPRRTDQPTCRKMRWVKVLNGTRPKIEIPKWNKKAGALVPEDNAEKQLVLESPREPRGPHATADYEVGNDPSAGRAIGHAFGDLDHPRTLGGGRHADRGRLRRPDSRGLSVCSGIEAASVAWEPAGIQSIRRNV